MSIITYHHSNLQNDEASTENFYKPQTYVQKLIEKISTWFTGQVSIFKPVVDKTMIICFSGALLSPLISPLIQKFISWCSSKDNEAISWCSSSNIFCVLMAINIFKFLYNVQMESAESARAMRDECKKEIEDTNDKIECLKSKIKMFDLFIDSNQKLKKLCIDYFNKFPSHKVVMKPLEEETVFETVFDENCYLNINLIRLERHLSERIEFIKSYKEVRECFEEHLNKNSDLFRKQSVPEFKEFMLEN
jgi:hypothetical protein